MINFKKEKRLTYDEIISKSKLRLTLECHDKVSALQKEIAELHSRFSPPNFMTDIKKEYYIIGIGVDVKYGMFDPTKIEHKINIDSAVIIEAVNQLIKKLENQIEDLVNEDINK